MINLLVGIVALPFALLWGIIEALLVTSDNPMHRDFIINHNIKYKK